MTGNNFISEFTKYQFEARVRQLTVVRYDWHGRRVIGMISGDLMRFPRFNYVPWASMSFKLHHTAVRGGLGDCGPNDLTDVILLSERDPSWEVLAGGTLGVLHGFMWNERDVDVFAHAR